MHFAILNIDGNGLALDLTKESMVDGHPSEGFLFGDIDNPHDSACFDLNVTIADGQRHHVLIEHLRGAIRRRMRRFTWTAR